jgi:hypothetical protein
MINCVVDLVLWLGVLFIVRWGAAPPRQ